MKFQTRAVHVGQHPEEKTGAVIPPIYQTTTYAQEAPGEHHGYEYTRAGNPNFDHLEAAIASLEEGRHGVVFSSGLGATMSLMMQLHSGDHVVCAGDVYGGTYRLLTHLTKRFGMTVSYIEGTDLSSWKTAINAKTKYVWIETPSNPLLQIVDIAAVVAMAKEKGVRSIVDNTFASPVLQQPLSLGADVVVHSTTKYIGGHSDVVGGAIVTNDVKLAEGAVFARMAYGLNPSPFDCWLTHRGLKTLGVRMARHVENAGRIAQYLQKHPRVEGAYYPGLTNHPGHDLARRQMSGFGGMVSARLAGSAQNVKKLLSQFRYFRLAESLGGVESLVCYPTMMTHASVPKEIREARGITETLVRFSVGIEDVEDLLEDLETVLKKL